MIIRLIKCLLICLVCNIIWSMEIDAASNIAQTCSKADVQSAINSAGNGDTVIVPAGSCTWTLGITISGKGINLIGAGASSTVITMNLSSGSLIDVSTNSTNSTRISGFTFNNAYTGQHLNQYYIAIAGDPTNAKFRIDHNTFNGGGTNCNTTSVGYLLGTGINVGNNAFGVIDHNTFNFAANAEMIHNSGRSLETASPDWTNDVIHADMLFVEDNTFTNSCMYKSGDTYYFTGNSALQNYYGARITFRYNTLTMSQIDVHGTPGAIGGRWYEIYSNSFNIVANGNQSDYMQLRAGSGVVFNNTGTIGAGGIGGGITLMEEDSGSYPQLYQIGRGKNQVVDPLYIWNNTGDGIDIGNGTPSLIQLNRDYYTTQKSGYTSYTYPHPLTTGKVDTIPPSSPPSIW